MTGPPPPRRRSPGNGSDRRADMTRSHRDNLDANGSEMGSVVALASGLMHASSAERERMLGDITNRNNETVREECARMQEDLTFLAEEFPYDTRVLGVVSSLSAGIHRILEYGLMDVPVPEPYTMADAFKDAGLTDESEPA